MKKLFFRYITTFELVVEKIDYYEENAFHRQSMCQETVLRFHISITETFSNSISPRLMKNMIKSAVLQIQAVFGIF